jgi:hypothetical protein
MRRMIRAYEQDLLQLLNETPNHPGGDWAKNDLTTLEYYAPRLSLTLHKQSPSNHVLHPTQIN